MTFCTYFELLLREKAMAEKEACKGKAYDRIRKSEFRK